MGEHSAGPQEGLAGLAAEMGCAKIGINGAWKKDGPKKQNLQGLLVGPSCGLPSVSNFWFIFLGEMLASGHKI